MKNETKSGIDEIISQNIRAIKLGKTNNFAETSLDLKQNQHWPLVYEFKCDEGESIETLLEDVKEYLHSNNKQDLLEVSSNDKVSDDQEQSLYLAVDKELKDIRELGEDLLDY